MQALLWLNLGLVGGWRRSYLGEGAGNKFFFCCLVGSNRGLICARSVHRRAKAGCGPYQLNIRIVEHWGGAPRGCPHVTAQERSAGLFSHNSFACLTESNLTKRIICAPIFCKHNFIVPMNQMWFAPRWVENSDFAFSSSIPVLTSASLCVFKANW